MNTLNSQSSFLLIVRRLIILPLDSSIGRLVSRSISKTIIPETHGMVAPSIRCSWPRKRGACSFHLRQKFCFDPPRAFRQRISGVFTCTTRYPGPTAAPGKFTKYFRSGVSREVAHLRRLTRTKSSNSGVWSLALCANPGLVGLMIQWIDCDQKCWKFTRIHPCITQIGRLPSHTIPQLQIPVLLMVPRQGSFGCTHLRTANAGQRNLLQ